MSRFDFYEFTGILAPGIALIVGLSFVFPELADLIQKQNFSIGDFGVVVIIAYIVGHLIQSFGNLIEGIYWWFWGGNPTDWIRTQKHKIISDGQVLDLKNRLKTTLKEEKVEDIHNLSKFAWRSITNEMYGRIKAENLDARAHIFNGNYGLMRGVVSCFIVLSIILTIKDINTWKAILFLVGGSVIAITRMHRFAKYYARELFTSYLNLPAEKEKGK